MRFIIGFLLFVGLAILIFVLVLSNNSGPSSKVKPPLNITQYASTDTVMRFSIDGPVIYDSQHYEIQITVGQSQNTISVLQGYQGSIIHTNLYPNNQNAYNEFLHALADDGFTDSRKITYTDVGTCATGNRYYFDVIAGDSTVLQNLWNSNCGLGSFAGTIGPIESLFQAQIPDYNNELDGVSLS